MMPYASLGNVATTARRSDPILTQTSKVTDEIVRQIFAIPPSQREREMNRILNDVQPGLAGKVRRVANHLGKKGMSSREALRAALRLTLADWALEYFKKVGEQRSVSGLGATVSKTLLNIGQGITCGIASSTEAQALAVRLQGGTQSTAGAATSVGFDVTRQICPSGGGSAPLPPPPPESSTSSIPWVPILIGGTLLVGIVVFVKTRG